MVDSVKIRTLFVRRNHARLQQPRLGVDSMPHNALKGSLGKTMTRTGDDAEELRERKKEVEELGNEEEKKGLGEVPEDAYLRVNCAAGPDSSEGHAGGVGEGVSHEASCREAVEVEERQRRGDEGHDDQRGEDVVTHVVCLSRPSRDLTIVTADDNVDHVDAEERTGDHDGLCITSRSEWYLTHLQAVHARVDVDAVGAEDAQQHDVHVVPPICSSCSTATPT